MTTDPIGLYVHIPFCVSKCNYCDFCSLGGAYDRYIDSYVKTLLAEAERYKRGKKITVNTLYFGGGTPSLLSPEMLKKILVGLEAVFDFGKLSEFTLEANPGTLTYEKAKGFKAFGVNRISLGLQSIHNNELKKLGRIHTFEDFLDSYKMLREVGFDNISVDLMYGIPEQTTESFCQTLSRVISLAPEHISAYGLIIEEGTPFFDDRDFLALPTEDDECDMYDMACQMLADAGYLHYEISNYSMPGYHSEHNLGYWRMREYIGLGAAAYSYLDGERYGNPRSLERYLGGELKTDVDTVDPDTEEKEYIMMRLRISDGIDLSEYSERFGKDFVRNKEEALSGYKKSELITLDKDRVALTERGFYLSNTIICDLIDL